VRGGQVHVADRFLSESGRPLPDGELRLGIRPEYLVIGPQGAPGTLSATVSQVQDIGTYFLVTLEAAGQAVKARLAPDAALPVVGAAVGLLVVGEHTCYYKNEELIA
jgi:glycerol transport system ATP-binding protein